jgi:hypothetical protein
MHLSLKVRAAMSIWLLLFIHLTMGQQGARQVAFDNLDSFEQKLLHSDWGDSTKIEWILPEQRPMATQRLRAMLLVAPGEGAYSKREIVENVLLALRDDEMLRQVAVKYQEGHERAGERLALYAREDAIQYIIPKVFYDSSKAYVPRGARGADEYYMPMYEATYRVYRLFAKSELLPPQTRAWAAQQFKVRLVNAGWDGPDGVAITSLRQWWGHNKAAVLSKKYDLATWLPPVEERIEQKINEPKTTTSQSTPIPSIAPASAQKPASTIITPPLPAGCPRVSSSLLLL